MSCDRCCGHQQIFTSKAARKQLKGYLKKGPTRATRRLIEFLITQKLHGMSLLDVGGGVGVIQFELINAGVDKVLSIDASEGYIEVAREEAEKRNLSDTVQYYQGDFVNESDNVMPYDIVTLDKVICCYEDMDGLVKESAGKANKYYGIIIPRDTWWVRSVHAVARLVFWIARIKMKTFIHPVLEIEQVIKDEGFEMIFRDTDIEWLILVYKRQPEV